MTWLTVKPNRSGVTREFDRMFDTFFNFPVSNAVSQATCVRPAVNISETDEQISLTLEAPGVDKKDIRVTVKDRVLTIEGSRKVQNDQEGVNYLVSEIRSGSFSRSFTLPETVDTEKIKADFNNGLLKVSLSKLEEVKPKEIEISIA